MEAFKESEKGKGHSFPSWGNQSQTGRTRRVQSLMERCRWEPDPLGVPDLLGICVEGSEKS